MSRSEQVEAEFLWAIRKWKDAMTPEELVRTLCEAPAFRGLLEERKSVLDEAAAVAERFEAQAGDTFEAAAARDIAAGIRAL